MQVVNVLLLSFFPILHGYLYNIVFKDIDISPDLFQSDLNRFVSHCRILQIYSNLISLNYYSSTISCETEKEIQALRSKLKNVKYFEKSIELEVAHLDKLHLTPHQPRSDIPDLSHTHYCTVTYDVFHSLSSYSSSKTTPIVS
jgi:hypothetical protein